MAITDLIFGSPVKAKIGAVTMDASVSETHVDEVEITEHPVEFGPDISDHIRKRPITLEISGIVTNTPLVFLASLFSKSPVDNDVLPSTDRVSRAYDTLRELQDKGELIKVVTSLREYENMAIQSIAIARDAANGQVLNATLSLRQVTLAKALSVDAPLIEEIGKGVKETVGKTPKESSSPAQSTKAQSTLFKVLG